MLSSLLECRTDILQVKTLLKGKGKRQRKIQLMLCEYPLRFILEEFYTTALVNIITWNAAYAIYPRATFLKHETFPLKPMDDYFGKLHAKYSQRGWRTRTPSGWSPATRGSTARDNVIRLEHQLDDLELDNLQFDDRSPTGRAFQSFRIGGKTTWRLALNIHGVKKPPQADEVIEYSSFAISIPQRTELVHFASLDHFSYSTSYSMSTYPFKSQVLRWRYLLPDALDDDAFAHLCERLTLTQMFKLKKEDRLRVIRPNHRPFRDDGLYKLEFDKPDGWW